MITLYDYYRSSACFRVRIALNLKGISYKVQAVNLVANGGEQYAPAYTEINPQQLVPTLEIDGLQLTQSLAIIEYIDAQYPTPPLLPTSAAARAQVQAFALAIAAEIHPLNNARVLNYLTQKLHINNEYKQMWYEHWIRRGFTALEAMLQRQQQSHDFCFGDTPSVADVFLVPQLYNARRFKCDLTPYPNLVRIDRNCQQLSAVQQAWPEAYEGIQQ